MNYYKRHIGDYAKKTGHLSPLEHGVYNLILDSYYDREIGPTATDAIRWARARTDEERSAVQIVLNEFFKLGEDGRYTQVQVEQNLQAYHAQAKANQITAKEREKRKRERVENEQSTNRAQGVNEDSTTDQPNHKPLTINQEPCIKTLGNEDNSLQNKNSKQKNEQEELLLDGNKATRFEAKRVLLSEGVDNQVAADFIKLRTAKRSPLSQSALDGIKREAIKAGLSLPDVILICVERGWQGFNASWLDDKKQQPQATKPAMSDKFNVRNMDYSSTDKAQAESFEKHGIRPQDYADTDQIEF